MNYDNPFEQSNQSALHQPPLFSDPMSEFYAFAESFTTEPTFQTPAFLDQPPRGPEEVSSYFPGPNPQYAWGSVNNPQSPFAKMYGTPSAGPSTASSYFPPAPHPAASQMEQQQSQFPPPNPLPLASVPVPAPNGAAPLPVSAPRALPSSLYSESGFDVMSVLARVATRPNPQISLGPVDFTCAFLVADATAPDDAIVYASPAFLSLTGYEFHEVIGRNCRFLQAPPTAGPVRKGDARRWTDITAVTQIHRALEAGTECQVSLLNYRKNGQGFVNLITLVPIRWDSDQVRYIVGFQIDLEAARPDTYRAGQDGSLAVNYSNANPSDPHASSVDNGPRMSEKLRTILGLATPDGNEEQERQKLNITLLDHSDDFVHVLSLKGSIQYVSSSVTQILEYTPDELVGKTIADITHPSDIIPVMRELKESSATQQSNPAGSGALAQHYMQQAKLVHLLFRVQRKYSGFVWIECTGRLQVEPGKGRKLLVMSGRIKHMPTLSWGAIGSSGGPGDSDCCWAHVSLHTGLLLVLSTSSTHNVFGHSSHEVEGTRVKDWVAPESKLDIDNALAVAMTPSSLPVQLICAKANSPGKFFVISFFPPTSNEPVASLSSSAPRRGLRPSYVVCSIRLSSSPQFPQPSLSSSASSSSGGMSSTVQDYLAGANSSSVSSSSRSRSDAGPSLLVEHAPDSNLFDAVGAAHDSSWQFEWEQLRIQNDQLKRELDALMSGSGAGAGGVRRDGMATMSSNESMMDLTSDGGGVNLT